MTTLQDRAESAGGPDQGDLPAPTFAENIAAAEAQYQSALSETKRLRDFIGTLFVNINHAPDSVPIEFVGFFCQAALKGCTQQRAFHKWEEKQAAALRARKD